ncbi:MAG: GNAT family N-acetyltransferase [Alphaproteobacteria bacterium]
MDVRIQPYSETYRDAVRDLIVPIQREEFGVDITYEDQPDLTQIPTFYQQNGGQFWLALDGDDLVGTIALADIGEQTGALRKMFVRESHRGKEAGVARNLLETLLSHAGEHGMLEIYLGTTSAFLAANRFYEKNGFELVQPDDLPHNFLRMVPDTRFYRYRLGG